MNFAYWLRPDKVCPCHNRLTVS